MKQLIHGLCNKLIPMKCWTWKQNKILMGINYWANKEEFLQLQRESKERNERGE